MKKKKLSVFARTKEKSFSSLHKSASLFRTQSISKFSNIDILGDAWENLPSDFTDDEKYMFLDIAEKIARMDKKLQDYSDEDIYEKN